MLSGESGVGKRFAANMIHQLSHRRRAPLSPSTLRRHRISPSAWANAIYLVTRGSSGRKRYAVIQDIEKIPASAQLQLLAIQDWALIAGETRAIHDDDRRPPCSSSSRQASSARICLQMNCFLFRHSAASREAEDIPLMFHTICHCHTASDVRSVSIAPRHGWSNIPGLEISGSLNPHQTLSTSICLTL